MSEKKINRDTVKWIVEAVLMFLLAVGICAIAYNTKDVERIKTLGSSSYAVGVIGDDGKIDTETKTAIHTKNLYPLNEVKIEMDKGANVTYTLFFYGTDKELMSKTNAQSSTYRGTFPEDAKYFRVMITPTADEDGIVKGNERSKYAKLVTVTYKNK